MLCILGMILSMKAMHYGYCKPYLACPQNLSIAYLEIPRTGCTMMKSYLAEIDGKRWHGHGTKLRCCGNKSETHNLIKLTVVRNPYRRLLSGYNHPGFCHKGSSRYDLCRQKYSLENKNDFQVWVQEAHKGKRLNTDSHLQPQYKYFCEEEDVCYTPDDFTILHLENFNQEWNQLFSSYPTPISTNQLQSTAKDHNWTLFFQQQSILNIVHYHYGLDFQIFGYNASQIPQVEK